MARALVLTTGILLCLLSVSNAQEDYERITVQGRLTRTNGSPLDSSGVSMTFKLWRSGGLTWSHTQSVDVVDGIFDVAIGPNIQFVPFNGELDLGITLDGDGVEMTPRIALGAVPFARALPGLYTVWATDNGASNEAFNTIGFGHKYSFSAKNVLGAGVEGAVIAGGGGLAGAFASPNSALADWATIGGGRNNTVNGLLGTIAGGVGGVAGLYGFVGGGTLNRATGSRAAVPGGQSNQARGDYSFAAGYKARAIHEGSFVWNDRSVTTGDDSLVTTAANQFLVRADGGVGVNTDSPANAFHVVDNPNGSASVGNHVAVVDNSSTGSGADVLALRVGRSSAPENTNAFITFKYDGNTSAGFIRGDGTGGIELVSEGADYAEYLRHRSADQVFEPGDVIGVFAGEISRQTNGADQIMVVSSSPIVLGNHSQMDEEEVSGITPVAFIGQAPVNVRGFVQVGDFLVPSDLGDGTAVAIDPADVTPDRLSAVFATAWESKTDAGIGKVNAAIGIDQAAASRKVIAALHQRTQKLEATQLAMLDRLEELERRMMP